MSDTRFEVIIAETAENDLEALFDYVSETRSVAIANALLDKIQRLLDALSIFPQRGSCPRELEGFEESEVRQLMEWPYRVIYEINGTVVDVFAVVDGRRDIQTLLQNRSATRKY
jgi:toxin ParE1/3/4